MGNGNRHCVSRNTLGVYAVWYDELPFLSSVTQ